MPNSNITGLFDDLPEHAEIYAAAGTLGYTPIVSTNLYLDRPLGTTAAMEALIGGTGVIDEVFDRQRMTGRSTEQAWLYCLTTSGAYEQIHKTNDDIVAEQMALLRRYYPAAPEAKVVQGHVVRMPPKRRSHRRSAYTDCVRGSEPPCRPSCWPAIGPPPTGRRPWRAPCKARQRRRSPPSASAGNMTARAVRRRMSADAGVLAYLNAAPTSWRLVLNPPADGPPELLDRIQRGRGYARRIAARRVSRLAGQTVDPDGPAIRVLLAAIEEIARLHLSDPASYPDAVVLEHLRSLLVWAAGLAP